MILGISPSFVAAALLLASSGFAYADSTYEITTIANAANVGTVSGSITGTGTTLTDFDVIAMNSLDTYTFDSSTGDTGSFSSLTGYTLSPSGSTLNVISLSDGAGDYFNLLLSGDFTSGLTPVQTGADVYINGIIEGTFGGDAVIDKFGTPVTADDVSLTLQPNVAPTPEPSSLLLMSTGLAGLCATLRRRLSS